jgi:hypothetical protein
MYPKDVHAVPPLESILAINLRVTICIPHPKLYKLRQASGSVSFREVQRDGGCAVADIGSICGPGFVDL